MSKVEVVWGKQSGPRTTGEIRWRGKRIGEVDAFETAPQTRSVSARVFGHRWVHDVCYADDLHDVARRLARQVVTTYLVRGTP